MSAEKSVDKNIQPGTAVQKSLPAFFLRTKLLLPRAAPELLKRPRLINKLKANLTQPVTLVSANAGYGKTTLVGDFIRQDVEKFVWYQLDHTDSDPLVFLGYLCFGISQQIQDYGVALSGYLEQSPDELAGNPEKAVDLLLNEILEKVDRQLVIVLDDYHHLGKETSVHKIVDRLLAYLPDVLHIIIISREIPPLAIARRLSQSSLSIIDSDELLFTDVETQELFRIVFDLEFSLQQLADYRERTKGWITALQLVRQVAQRQLIQQHETKESIESFDLTEILRQSERDIFDYFAEEVFADEEQTVKDFLLRIALLDRIDLDTCTKLFPNLRTSYLLPALIRRNVFISVASDEGSEEYRLHPLFKSFLRRRLREEIGRKNVAAEHSKYAEHFLDIGKWEFAIRHLLEAEEYDKAAFVIAEHGETWIANGALTSLASFANQLPVESLEKHPRSLAHRAEVERLQGKIDNAFATLNRATTLLHELGDTLGEAESLHSLAAIARRRADYEGAFNYLNQAVLLVEEKTLTNVKCGNTRGLCYVALSEWTKAEFEFRVALQIAEELNEEKYIRLIAHNLGTPAGIRGDFGEALRWLRRMLRESKDAPPLPQEAVAHLNMARCYFYRGDFTASEKHLDLSLELCQLFDLTNLKGEIFEAYGNLYREKYDYTHASEYYERAKKAYSEAGIDLSTRELLEEQSVLRWKMEDRVSAFALLDKLLESRQKADEYGQQTVKLMRGRLLQESGEMDEAIVLLEPALTYFHEHTLFYNEAQAAITLSSCLVAKGKEHEALNHLRRAIDLAARYDYDFWLRNEVVKKKEYFQLPEFIELLPTEIREEITTSEIQSEKAEKKETQIPAYVVTEPISDLTIKMLGSIEIYRDPSKPFASDAWTTKRARDILCFIASSKNKRASKDIIIDTFWGEADFDVVEKNFHPTVSHIRKALNSKQLLKQNFLLYRDGDYQLNSAFNYSIDTEEFERLIEEGKAAQRNGQLESLLQNYESAIKLYRGEFMQSVYDDWVIERRGLFHKQYLSCLEVLMLSAQQKENWHHSLELAQLILNDDVYREEVHCAIMQAHTKLNNRAAVKDQFEKLKKLLLEELGIEPSERTKETYKKFMS